jgi:PncC family amidohydrolase
MEVPSDDELVDIARRIQAACLELGLSVSTAESCTGGLVGHLITEVAGSSGYYQGGVVAYTDALKRQLLDVPGETLEKHGAVSAQVAVAMAEGARSRFGATVGVAVTGIAGPDGGTASKPVGLTYVATSDAHGHDVRRSLWSADRSGNKRESARAALELLLERVSSHT